MILNPAEVVIHEFGGVCQTARLLGVDKSTISKWKTSKDNHGTGGMIPTAHQKTILELARQKGIYLTAEELIFGRVYEEETA